MGEREAPEAPGQLAGALELADAPAELPGRSRRPPRRGPDPASATNFSRSALSGYGRSNSPKGWSTWRASVRPSASRTSTRAGRACGVSAVSAGSSTTSTRRASARTRGSDSAGSRKASTPQSPHSRPEDEPRREAVRDRELRAERPDRVPVAHRGAERRGRDADRRDPLGRDGRRLQELLDRVDGGVVVPAAGVALEVVARDLEALAEPVQGRGRVEPGAADPAEDLGEHVGQAA